MALARNTVRVVPPACISVYYGESGVGGGQISLLSGDAICEGVAWSIKRKLDPLLRRTSVGLGRMIKALPLWRISKVQVPCPNCSPQTLENAVFAESYRKGR